MRKEAEKGVSGTAIREICLARVVQYPYSVYGAATLYVSNPHNSRLPKLLPSLHYKDVTLAYGISIIVN